MKKSSFLHKPKDMLSHSFKPAKCKTALKMATSRMKLLKNKKEEQVKKMKRELAQLLESGQDQTARIRVEHVIREEKMVAAYELLDIYCELIVARLPIIESQKECPIDLKEPVTSVIFASPRCGDIPELSDARKHLTAKYGKEFVSKAIELRPNSGVSRLLVEKLSANAPDGQTKMKTLAKIAEEHNIKWDPNSLGQSDIVPPNDFLDGPKTFGASTVLPEAPPYATPQAPPTHDKTDNQPMNFSEQNVRSTPGRQGFASGQDSISRNAVSSIHQEQMKPPGPRQDKGQVSESFQREGSGSFSGQSWNMEFKDATSAAQAAAESAERASIAARAAAELSSLAQTATRPHYSSEPHNSRGDLRRDERPGRHATSKHTSDYVSQDSVASSLQDRQKPRVQNRRTGTIEQENRKRSSKSYSQDGSDTGNQYGHITALRPETSVQDETLAHSFPVPDGISQKGSPKKEETKNESSMRRKSGKFESEDLNHLRGSFAVSGDDMIRKQSSGLSSRSSEKGSPRKEEIKTEINTRRQSGKFETQDLNHPQGSFGAENFAYSGEDVITKQSSVLSSRSHSSTSRSEDEFSNFGHQTFSYDADTGAFVRKEEEYDARDTWAPSHTAADAPVVFDDSGSDVEDIWSSTGFTVNEELNSHFASPGRSSPSNLRTYSGNASSLHTSGRSSSVAVSGFSIGAEFSDRVEVSKDGPHEDTLGPVTFDDSDGSESDTGVLPAEHGALEDVRYPSSRQKQSLASPGSEIHRNDSQKTKVIVGETPISQSSLGLGKSPQVPSRTGIDGDEYLASSQSKVLLVHEVKDNISSGHSRGENMEDEKSDDEKVLNFNNLTGGFRHRPPYTRNQVDYTTSTTAVSGEGPPTIRQSAGAYTVERFTDTGKEILESNGRNSRVPVSYSGSDSDSSIEEVKEQPASLGQKREDTRNGRKDSKIQSHLRGSVTYFDSESSDSDDDSAVSVMTSKSNVGSGFSRRTKPSHSSSTSVSKLKAGSSSKVNDSGSGTPATRTYGAETPQEYLSWNNRNSDQLPKSDQTSIVNDSGSGRTPASRTSGAEAPQEHLNWNNRNSDQRPKSEQASIVNESGSGRTPATRTYGAETPQERLSWNNRNLDQRPKSEQTSIVDESGSGRTPATRTYGAETPQEGLSWNNRKSDQRPKSEQTSIVNDSGSGRTPATRTYGAETPQERLSWNNRKSDQRPKSEQTSIVNDSGSGRTPATRTYGAEAPQEHLSWNSRKSDHQAKSEQTSSQNLDAKPARKSQTSSAVEPPARSDQKEEKSESTENEKAPSGTSIGREDSLKKPSHVHPKLPDYETLAARFQAIRMNRQ